MLEALSTAQLFLCWMISGVSARKMQRLEFGIIWKFVYSHVRWLILATDWNCSWCYYPEHLYMASSNGWLGFLIAWWLGFKSKHPKLHHILWPSLRSHIVSYHSQIRDHIDTALNGWSIKVTLSEEHVEWKIMLQPFWKLQFTQIMLYFLFLRPWTFCNISFYFFTWLNHTQPALGEVSLSICTQDPVFRS